MGEFISGIAVKGENTFYLVSPEESVARAAAISEERSVPVLAAYIYDGDFWGYTLYMNGEERGEFATIPEYFDKGEAVRAHYSADVGALADAFGVAPENIERYLLFWTDAQIADDDERAYPSDTYPYGDPWQMVDFLRALGFSYPEDDEMDEEAFDGEIIEPVRVTREVLENIDINHDSTMPDYLSLQEIHPDTVALEDLFNSKSTDIPGTLDKEVLSLRTKALYDEDAHRRIDALNELFWRDKVFSKVYQIHQAWEYHRLGKDDVAKSIVGGLMSSGVVYKPDFNDFAKLYEELGFGRLRPEYRFFCEKKCSRGAFAIAQLYRFRYELEGCYVTDSAGNEHFFADDEEREYFTEREVWV